MKVLDDVLKKLRAEHEKTQRDIAEANKAPKDSWLRLKQLKDQLGSTDAVIARLHEIAHERPPNQKHILG